MCFKSSKVFNRRDLIKSSSTFSLAAGVTSMLRPTKMFANTAEGKEPHFFLHVNIGGGLDANYLFDSRPLDMTTKGLLTNYHGKDPVQYVGTNGQATLRTTLTDSLMKWSDRFSIINISTMIRVNINRK